jgi:hypothetical protein
MNEEQKRKALEEFVAQMQPGSEQQRNNKLLMEGMEPGSPQMEEAMNMAGGAMGSIGKAPKILKSMGPSRFSKLVPQGVEGGYAQRLAPELKNIPRNSLEASDPLMQGLRSKLDSVSEMMDKQKIMQLIESFSKKSR